jgi:hypothetical protein
LIQHLINARDGGGPSLLLGSCIAASDGRDLIGTESHPGKARTSGANVVVTITMGRHQKKPIHRVGTIQEQNSTLLSLSRLLGQVGRQSWDDLYARDCRSQFRPVELIG